MKNIFILILALPLLSVSCKKDDKCPYTESGASASTAERAYLQSYLSTNGLAAVEHTSGVFYTITTPGSGSAPSICSNIKTKYKGSFIPGGNGFDSSYVSYPAGINFTLGQVIVGWQKVLPLLKPGGKALLYIPPSLAYGSRNYPSDYNIAIPANSYLKFEIELVSVQ